MKRFMNTFIKQNDMPIPVDYIGDEHEERLNCAPSFWFENRRHYLFDFDDTDMDVEVENEVFYTVFRQNDGTRGSFENPMYLVFYDNETVDVYRERAV